MQSKSEKQEEQDLSLEIAVYTIKTICIGIGTWVKSRQLPYSNEETF